MFNLENKITWKELAPSLQAMFKTLQSQITDVKNEVNNINISLGDINDHLTQIDNSITNIEGDITNINKDISEINNNITNIEGDISNIENNIEEVTNITNNITGMFATGEQGQVVKIDSENNGLFVDDNFHTVYVVNSNQEVEDIKSNSELNPTLYMQNILNTWYRFIHYDNPSSIYMDYTNNLYSMTGDKAYYHAQNQELTKLVPIYSSILNKESDSWRYESSTNSIRCGFDEAPAAGFLNKDKIVGYNYYIHFFVNSDVDNDHFFIIIGFMTDDSGVEHTLSYIKAEGRNVSVPTSYLDKYYDTGLNHIDSRVWNAVVYDFMNPTQKIIADNSAIVKVAPYLQSKNFKVHCAVRRSSERQFVFYSSQWSQEPFTSNAEANFVDDFTLNYTFPSSKPSDWSDEMWSNVNTMLKTPYFGVGSRSNNSSFKIVEQEGIFDYYEKVFDIENNKYYQWDFSSSQYVDKGSITTDVLPNRVFLYNDYLNKLYFYISPKSYVQIKGGYST